MIHIRNILLATCCLFAFWLQPTLAEDKGPLQPDEAFTLTVQATDHESLLAEWHVAPGYYLYHDRIHFALKDQSQGTLGQPLLPKGTMHNNTLIYTNEVKINIPIMTQTKQPLELLVSYQGCSTGGYCYPPTTKQVSIDMNGNYGTASKGTTVAATAPEEPVEAYTEQDAVSELLTSHAYFTIILTFLGFGFLLAFTPCVLPMYPILSGIIVGHKQLHTRKAFWLSMIYVLSMSFTYAIGGMLAGYIGGSVQVLFQQPWIILIFSLTFVVLALSFFGFYDIKLPAALETKLTNISNHQKRGSYIGVIIMGVLATLIVSPCVTPALVGALGYISESGDAILGGSALFALGFGMGIPLIIVGTLGGKYLPKAGAWMDAVKDIFGVLMLAMAIWMLSRILPPAMTLLAWGALFVISAMFMGTFNPIDNNKWHKLRKGCGVIVLVYGILMIIGSGFGNSDPMIPLSGILESKTPLAANTAGFKTVKNLTDVRRELAKSRAEGKFLLLDFYADWCISCKSMASNTFQDPEVIKLLDQFNLVQADVTSNDSVDKTLENHFNVLAPPTIIFFGPQCSELKQYRIVGEMDAKKFKSILEMMLHDQELSSKRSEHIGMNNDEEICT